jgi:hypothetical protein
MYELITLHRVLNDNKKKFRYLEYKLIDVACMNRMVTVEMS